MTTRSTGSQRKIALFSVEIRFANFSVEGFADLADNIANALSGDWPTGVCPPLWDGATAKLAVERLNVREQNRS